MGWACSPIASQTPSVVNSRRPAATIAEARRKADQAAEVAAEKARLAYEIFGKQGAEALKLLSDGTLRIRNNKLLKSLNAAGNADLDLIGTNGSNGLVLGSGLSGLLLGASSVISALPTCSTTAVRRSRASVNAVMGLLLSKSVRCGQRLLSRDEPLVLPQGCAPKEGRRGYSLQSRG